MTSFNPISYPEEADHQAEHQSVFPFRSFSKPYGKQTEQNVSRNRMQQLEEMLHEAQGRAEIIEKEAYDKAYLAGEKAGLALGKKRGEQILESVADTLKDVETDLSAIQQSFAEAAMELAQYIAEQITGKAVQNNTEMLWDIAQKAASQLPEASGLKVAISPDDYHSFERLLEDSPSQIILSRDASVAPGTCRIISTEQDILVDPVAAVAAYLEHLRPALLSGKPDEDHAG